MIILGEPNQLVCIHQRRGMTTRRKPAFRFDANGEFETDDPKILKRARTHFTIIESKSETASDIKPIRTCKTCGAEFDNVGEFLKHMREHKKEDTDV